MVILGDFNSVEQDSPCWLLRRGRLERNHTDACCPQARRPAGAPPRAALRPGVLCVCAAGERRRRRRCLQAALVSRPYPVLQVPTTKESIAHPFALHEAYEAAGYRQPFTRKARPGGWGGVRGQARPGGACPQRRAPRARGGCALAWPVPWPVPWPVHGRLRPSPSSLVLWCALGRPLRRRSI